VNRLNINQARREALFASDLKRSDVLTADALIELINCTVRRLGIAGCISLMAQKFGDHPETAAERMRWIRRLANEAFASRAAHRAAEGTRAPTAPSSPAAAAGSSALNAA